MGDLPPLIWFTVEIRLTQPQVELELGLSLAKNAKLGMQKLRSELSDRWLEYENITDKHRKRAERLNIYDVKNSKDNLKAKDAMKQLHEQLSDEYIPRGRQNITEEDDWKNFYDMNEDNKELLEELTPLIVKKSSWK
jgi:hypothetical protein